MAAKYERLIGRGEKDLFAKTKDDCHFVVISKTLDRNFKRIKLGDYPGLVVNLNYYKEFLTIIRNRKKTVELFLQKLSKEEENLIRNWLRSYERYEEVKEEEARIYDVERIIEVLRKYKIESASDLQRIITVAKASGGKIPESWEFFEPVLIKFKWLIDGDYPEIELRNFLFENPWLIDFSFLRYQKYKEEPTGVGDIDISFYKDEMGIEKVCIVELKKASEPITSEKYRGKEKPVILAEVGKALPQTMHYIKDLKRKKRIIKGIVIVGRRKEVKDWFIDQFNHYLHGIEVKTYDDLHKRAEEIIETFKGQHASRC